MRVPRILTPEYRAAQLAGSQRLEGIRVTRVAEHQMASIIRGDASEEQLIKVLDARYNVALRVVR